MKVNINSFQADYFLKILKTYGVQQVVISPGSRSTSLALAFLSNKHFFCTPIIDERAAAFYATGIARATSKPVALLCTSGTAVAEYYPAIIEAYQQRIPLVVCTADRPEHLIGTGANQTIVQDNIYKNHIRCSVNIPVPAPDAAYFDRFSMEVCKALQIGITTNRGPVHINLQYEKPFEPDSITHTLPKGFPLLKVPKPSDLNISGICSTPAERSIAREWLQNASKIAVLVGPASLTTADKNSIFKLSKFLRAPILADIGSQLRQSTTNAMLVITHYDTILRGADEQQQEVLRPEVLIVFGMHTVSAALNRFIEASPAKRIIINPYGDRVDTTENERVILSGNSVAVISELLDMEIGTQQSGGYLDVWQKLNRQVDSALEQVHLRKQLDELGIIRIVRDALPQHATVMLANSLTYRVFDDFSGMFPGSVQFFQNRGASGIDGIIATTAGIASSVQQPVFLVIGDVTLFYDLTSLLLLRNAKQPATVLLLNNQGGRIFDVLPVRKYLNEAYPFFRTPAAYHIKKAVEAFGGTYKRIEQSSALTQALQNDMPTGNFRLYDLIIDPEFAEQRRMELRAANQFSKAQNI